MAKPRTEKSMELYDIMLKRGYPAEFCEQITLNLNTDWTAQRMIGYLSHYKKLNKEAPRADESAPGKSSDPLKIASQWGPPMEDVADEMLAILSDRSRIMQKKGA